MSVGIYKIQNKENGMIYIGLSSNVETRINTHKGCVNKKNIKLPLIDETIRELGVDAFTYEIIDTIPQLITGDDKAKLSNLEQHYIKLYDCKYPKGYNLNSGGCGHFTWCDEYRKQISDRIKGENNPFYGRKHTEETKRKLSEHFKGVCNLTEEGRKRISDANKGRKHSEETRKKMSENNAMNNPENRKKISDKLKGRVITPEWHENMIKARQSTEYRKKLSEKLKGRKFSEEHKQHIKDAWAKRKLKGTSDETRKKMSDAQKGRKHTEETKRKISESNIGKHSKKRKIES